MPPDHPQLWILALQSNGPAHMGISTALDGQEALSTTMCPINTFLHLGCHALLLMVSEVLWIQTMALLTLQDQRSLQGFKRCPSGRRGWSNIETSQVLQSITLLLGDEEFGFPL